VFKDKTEAEIIGFPLSEDELVPALDVEVEGLSLIKSLFS